jgi:Rrf2 family protein
VLTQASELAIQALVILGLRESDEPVTPRDLAQQMGCSHSYLSKVLGSLTREGLLVSVRGARGGVMLVADPREVTLLSVVEACDGFLVGNYCRSLGVQPTEVCGFHEAMKEVHDSVKSVLRRRRLSDLLARPVSVLPDGSVGGCKMAFHGCEDFLSGSCGCDESERRAS